MALSEKALAAARILAALAAAIAVSLSLAFGAACPAAWADDPAAEGQAQSEEGSASAEQTAQAESSDGGAAVAATSEGAVVESAPAAESKVSLDGELNSVKENQLPDSSFIYDSSIADLAGADSYYDQMTVQVVGEAVNDIISEGVGSDHCWVALWDKGETITVYMSREDADLIDTLGSYGRTGTMLQVRGVFNLVCADHEGVSDLHAESVQVTAKGSAKDQPFVIGEFTPGFVLLLLGAALAIGFLRLREKQR